MKTLFSGPNSVLTLLLLFATTAVLPGCNREDGLTDPPAETMTDAQAAQIVESAITEDGEGLDAALADAVAIAAAPLPTSACGNAIDSTFTVSRNTDRLDADYDVTLTYTPSCGPGGLVRSITYGRTSAGTYTTNRLRSEDNSNSNFTLDNLNGGTSLLVSGQYVRNGTQEITVRDNGRSYNTAFSLEVTALSINKGTRRLESGQAGFTLTGTSSAGRNVDVVGTIVFRGAGNATVIINGNQFEISR